MNSKLYYPTYSQYVGPFKDVLNGQQHSGKIHVTSKHFQFLVTLSKYSCPVKYFRKCVDEIVFSNYFNPYRNVTLSVEKELRKRIKNMPWNSFFHSFYRNQSDTPDSYMSNKFSTGSARSVGYAVRLVFRRLRVPSSFRPHIFHRDLVMK